MRIANCHILFFSLVFLLYTAPVQGKTLSIEHAFFKYDKDRNIHTYTSPRVAYGNTTISGREMLYDKNTEIMYFSGNIVIRLPGIVLTADKATFDHKEGKNTLFKSTMYDSKNGVFIDAERIEQINDETYVIYQGALTRCSPGSKAWELRGRQIYYTIDNYAYSLGTSFHFYTLPIFYSPYVSWPTKQGRSTGLLMPTFTSVDSSDVTKSYGGRLQLPYFIALDQDHDVTITADIIQRRGLGVDIDYLYAFTPDMSGQFQAWFIKETQQERDLDLEPMNTEYLYASLDPASDSFDLNPARYKYQFDHRQNIFLDGQFRFHQHGNSDNEINKEYFDAAVGLESHYSQTFSLVFPWDSGNLSLAYETADNFRYKSTYDTTTDIETHLNRQPTGTVSQRFSRIADTPFSVNVSGTETEYTRIYGWNGLYRQGNVSLTAPFYLDFLNIWPSLTRSYYDFDTRYQARPSDATEEPETYGWMIDSGELELNFEIYRLFYNYENVATQKLSFRPRVIYNVIQDVDQSEDDNAALLAPIMSQKTLTYKLETRYLVKNPGVRTYFSLDLTQIYNLQMEDDQTYYSQPNNLETEQDEPQLPLRIDLSVSPTSLFTAGLFYRFDHEKSRVVETGINLSTRSKDGSKFSLDYTNNETLYREPDNTNHPVARIYSITHNLRLNDRLTLYMKGAWDQTRSSLSYQYSGTQAEKRLDRQLTDLTATIIYRHDCYNFSASYVEDIETELLKGVTTEFLEKKFTLTLQFQVLPANTEMLNQTTGAQYQQGFLLPN